MPSYQVTSPSGDNYVVQNSDDSAAQQAAMELANSFGPATTAMGAAGRGALDAIPFGEKAAAGAEAAIGSSKYKDYLAQLDQLIAADKQQHPIAHDVGEIAGTAAPLAIPGVGEALSADTLAGRAGIGAGIGALQAASANRDTSQLPQELLKGAGVGAVVNPAVGALGDAVSGTLSKTAQGAESFANAEAVKSGGFRAGMLGRLSEQENQQLGQFMRDHNLVEGDLPTRLQKAQLVKQVYGNKIGTLGDAAATLDDPTSYMADLKNESDQYSGMVNPEAKALGNTYLAGSQDIENNLPPGSTYQDIQHLKERYSGLAFNADHTVKNHAAADVYGTLRQMQKDLVNQSPAEYQKAMQGYGTSADIVDGLTKQLGTSRAGSGTMGGGISKTIRGFPGMENPNISIPAGLGMMGAGKTFSGLMVAGQGLNNPAFKSGMASSLANTATTAAQGS